MTFDPKEARAQAERLTGYTPGPWRNADGVIQSKTKVTHPDGGEEWTFKYARIIGEVTEDFDYIRNGNLIAAAPDLHAALTAMVDEVERLTRAIKTMKTQAQGE